MTDIFNWKVFNKNSGLKACVIDTCSNEVLSTSLCYSSSNIRSSWSHGDLSFWLKDLAPFFSYFIGSKCWVNKLIWRYINWKFFNKDSGLKTCVIDIYSNEVQSTSLCYSSSTTRPFWYHRNMPFWLKDLPLLFSDSLLVQWAHCKRFNKLIGRYFKLESL